MKSLLLLILPLIIGCEAFFEARACRQGWVQFTWKYPETNTNYEYSEVFTPSRTTLRSSQKDVWENKGRLSLYHDTKNKNLKLAVKNLEQRDFGVYVCKFYQRSNSSPDIKKMELESGNCQQPFTQTVPSAAKPTITCDYPDDELKSWVKFLCKVRSFTCEDILSTKSPLKSDGTFTLTDTRRGFKVSIGDVSSQDAGVYWCGLESNDGSCRVSVRQIKLDVKEPPTTSATHSATSPPTVPQPAVPPEGFGVSGVVIAVIVCVAVMAFLGFSILIYKRFSSSKNRRTAAALQHVREDFGYKEIQECLQQPDAETKTNFTANISTNIVASPHYTTINFQNRSDKGGGEPMKPNSSACEYSAVKLNKCLAQLNRPTEENLYSAVNEPQQK